MVRATVQALGKVNSPRQVAARRGKKVSDVISQRISDNEVSA
jgi:small subunit ribosomal protein S5